MHAVHHAVKCVATRSTQGNATGSVIFNPFIPDFLWLLPKNFQQHIWPKWTKLLLVTCPLDHLMATVSPVITKTFQAI